MSEVFERFHEYRRVSDQAADAYVVTPSDSTDLDPLPVAFETRADGLVRVTTLAGTTLEVFCAAGIAKPLLVRRIHDTGTDSAVKTAGIVALV
jgi:hypothetical protein